MFKNHTHTRTRTYTHTQTHTDTHTQNIYIVARSTNIITMN